MKINFNQNIFNVKGEPLKDTSVDDKENITLKKIAVDALLRDNETTGKESGEKKLERWQLARKIQKSSEPIDITAEEISNIKNKIATHFSTSAVGPAFELLENSNTE